MANFLIGIKKHPGWVYLHNLHKALGAHYTHEEQDWRSDMTQKLSKLASNTLATQTHTQSKENISPLGECFVITIL